MYNKRIKEEYINFINEDNIRAKVITRIFNFSEELEIKKGKDLFDFTEEDFIELLKSYASCSQNVLSTYCSFVRPYVQWACDNNIVRDNINHLEYIDKDTLKKCVNKYAYNNKYISYEDLMKIVKTVVNPCDQSIILGYFFGIKGDNDIELVNITNKEIDIENKKIYLITGRCVEVPEEVCKIFLTSCNTYEYINTNVGSKIASFDLDTSDDRVFKKRANSNIVTTVERENLRVKRRLGKMRDELNCQALTVPRLRGSGMLYYMKKAIENGVVTKDDIYLSSVMEKIKKQYDCENVEGFTLKSRFEDFL